MTTLISAGVVRRPLDGLRILGEGDLKAKVQVTANHVSAKAREAIEKAGGSIKLIEKKVLKADTDKAAKHAAKVKAKASPAKKAAAEE